MEWRGVGILVAVRRHGESSAIIEVFTENHGLHAGVVRGGAGRRMGPILQPGAQLDVVWRARLEDHIGSYTVEPIRSRAAAAMSDRLMLAGLNAVTGLLSYCLPSIVKLSNCLIFLNTQRFGHWPILNGKLHCWPKLVLDCSWMRVRCRVLRLIWGLFHQGQAVQYQDLRLGNGPIVCCRCQIFCVV